MGSFQIIRPHPPLKNMKTVLCSLLLSTAAMATEGAGWTLHPGGPWQVSGSLKGKKDVSAIDLISSSTGLLASDEGSLVQAVRLDAALRTLTLGAAWPLLGPKQEADIEGIAAAPAENCYFVTGSHAISRKKMELEPSRFHIFRVRLNPATQAPFRRGGYGHAAAFVGIDAGTEAFSGRAHDRPWNRYRRAGVA